MADNVISKIKLPDNQEYILKDSDAARSNHTHSTSLAEDSTGTSSVSLKAGTKYKLTSGGTSYIFTTPADTHHQAKLIVGATSTAVANAAVTANSIYANVIENNQVRSSNNIVGGGSVTVSSNADGTITITGNKSGTVTSITPGNGLLNGTGTDAIRTSGTLNIDYGTSVSNVSGNGSLVGTANTVSRSDHTHKIEIDEGTNNGEISIAGVTVKPKGIAALAYKASLVAGDIPDLAWSKITSGKPTTLSGYGITDAKIANGVITLGSNTITPVTSVNGHTGSVVNVTAGDLGLSSALRYVGKTTSTMSESFTGVPAGISGYTKPIVGDVVLDSAGNGEYVCVGVSGTTYTWESLGSESSFKKVQTAVSSPSAGNSAQIEFIDTISQDVQGVISATKQSIRTASTTQTGVIQITKNNANLFLNALDTGDSIPDDNDYYISQFVNGGTTTTTYHRRPIIRLYSYIKNKTDTLYPTKAGGGATGTWGIGISGNAATATKFASAQSITLTGDASGTASSQAGWSISTVNKYITGRGRPETANIENGSHLSKFFTFLASSSMTEGKPVADGSIAYFGWDNSGWAGELYVPNAKNGQLQFRGASNNSGASDWEDWVTVLDTRNYTTTLDSTYVKKTAGITAVTWDSTNNKLTRTINGTTSDVVTLATIKTALGTMTPSSHAHGNITNGGTITSTAVALANGDNLLFADSSSSGKIERSSITIGTATNTWLCNNGTWTTPTAAQVGAVALANGVTAVTWDSTNKRVTRTINGTAANVVEFEGTSPITVTGAANKLTIAHNDNSGYKHIPSGGESGQFLGWDSDGTAKWVANPNSDTKVTSVGNHYTPAADTNSQLSASASGATAAWSIDVVKAVQLQRDAKGHVTGVTVTSGKIPANPNTWRGIQDNLTSDSATDSLSAKQGKALANGSARDSTKLPLTGGKMTGRIYREGVSTGWNKGRDNALVATSSINGYSPFASIKTTNGSWDIGAYDNGSYIDDLVFSYVSDTVYSGTNTTPTQIKFLENGHIVAALDGNATSATTATNLANKPSLAVSDTSKITVTAGGKTSDAFTVPYATSAGSAAAATTATNLSAAPTITKTGTSTIDLTAGTAYTLTVGGQSVIFKTPADSDTKVTLAAITSGTVYYPVVGTGTGNAQRQIDTTGFAYKGTNGTTSAVGAAELTLGNSTASGTANNKQGKLTLYGSTAYTHTLLGAPTSARTITLPDATGTVELTSHIHGNLTHDGKITSTTTIANGDKLVIVDSDSKIIGSSITFDGSTTTKALTQKGTWETFNNYSHPTGDGNLHVPATGTTHNGQVLKAGSTAGSISWGTLSASDVGAATSGHTHKTTVAEAASGDTNSLTLAFNKKYKLTAGDTNFVFTTPANPNTNTTYTIASGDSSGQIKITPSVGDAYNVKVKDINTAAYRGVDSSIGTASTSTNLATSSAVASFIEGKGYVTSSGVTQIATGSGLTGGPITTIGTISIATGGVTNDMLAGSIANGKLANSSISIAGTSVSLGSTLAAETLRTNLGLSNAMHFIGKATVAIIDGSTTNPTINGYDFTNKKAAGDVIIDKDTAYEYVWTTEGKWERLGGDSSYKVTQTAVAKPNAVTNKWVSAIGQNVNGVIDASYTTLDTSGTWSGSAGKLTSLTTSDNASSTATWRYVWFSYNDLVTGRPAYSDKLVYQTSTNTLKIDTGTLTATQYSGNAATATTATNATLLKPIASTTTASASTWSIPSGSYQVWGEKFSDTRLKYTPSGGSETTVTDTGDWTIWLTPDATANKATLNMRIDGTYYGSFSGNLTGTATTATNLANKPSIAASGNNITITAGGKTSDAFTVPYATNAGTATTANKLGTADKGSGTKPIYLADGVATECSTYAGGTAVTLNGVSKAASTASFYAPTSAGSNTQILVGGTPSWVYPGISIGAGTSSAAPTIGFTTSTSSISAQSITIASTSVYGVTKLQDGVSSDSTVLAATAKAAKTASTSATHTLATTTKFFVTGCTSSTTNTAGDDFDTGVYVTTTAGEFSAIRHSYNVAGAERAYTHYNMTDQSIDFVFV